MEIDSTDLAHIIDSVLSSETLIRCLNEDSDKSNLLITPYNINYIFTKNNFDIDLETLDTKNLKFFEPSEEFKNDINLS